jgi:hypothetical protein
MSRSRPIAIIVARFRYATERCKVQMNEAKLECLKRGYVPIFLPDTLKSVLSDYDKEERITAVDCAASFVRAVALNPRNQLVVVHDDSGGCQSDIDAWKRRDREPVTLENLPRATWLSQENRVVA